MKVQLRFFASLRERLHRSEAEYVLGVGADVEQLWTRLCTDFPEIEPLRTSISIAVNREYVDRTHVLADGDEVALIPPVSGGL